MDLIGQTIKHKAFGSGVVTDLTDGVVTIRFENEEKKFIYPDAFNSFLLMKNEDTQRRIEKQIEDREAEAERTRQAEQEEQDRKRKLTNFKIVNSSHLVFNVVPELAARSVEQGEVYTGTYLSGYSKGMPRVADRVKPNSVCLITTCLPGQHESERVIAGAFMVREDFFGAETHDGVIRGHGQYRLLLPQDGRPLFWEYFGQNAPARWGSTAFKYCSGDVASRILSDIAQRQDADGQESGAAEFYEYFCKMNQIRPLTKQE